MPESAANSLDVITFGRSSVDLYGQQIGSRLEDVGSFAKSVGGCPANIAIGAARLGLRSAIVTGVGDEQMGRYIKEQMAREGVDIRGIKTDAHRLTALVLLSVENDKSFPLIFVRENCADMAVGPDDVDEAFVREAKAVLVTGTHFSTPLTSAAQEKAIRIARAEGARVILDIDYRPNLWGLAGHAAGEERYIKSDTVSQHLQRFLGHCDLIVGTEEEVAIAGGAEATLAALRKIRSLSAAVIVLKRGPMGCVVFDGPIPGRIEDGIIGQGFPIEVYNVLGAGDSFMSGYLRGYLRGEPHQTSATWANACGAFAVSRLLCSPEIPTWDELQYFLKHGSPHEALRRDAAINHVHWATTRRPKARQLLALAIDHRMQLEEMADAAGAAREAIGRFKRLAVAAVGDVAAGRPGFGTLLDDLHGREAMFDAAKLGLWVARPLEQPGSRPLQFEFTQDVGSRLTEWPVTHTVKVLAFYHPDDPADLKTQQMQKLTTVFEAARKVGRELLVEIICGKHGRVGDFTVARALTELYALGIKPDWWKLEAQSTAAAWANIGKVIAAGDAYCRGVVVLGLEAPEKELARAFRLAAAERLVRGFAVGRSIFNHAAREWLAGRMDDAAARADMAARFARLVEYWNAAQNAAARTGPETIP